MPTTKYIGLSYPNHFKRSRDSVIRNIFLEYRSKQINNLHGEMILYIFDTNKAKHILHIGIVRVPVVTRLICKGIKKNHKKSHF